VQWEEEYLLAKDKNGKEKEELSILFLTSSLSNPWFLKFKKFVIKQLKMLKILHLIQIKMENILFNMILLI
jgi:hypothetical protein